MQTEQRLADDRREKFTDSRKYIKPITSSRIKNKDKFLIFVRDIPSNFFVKSSHLSMVLPKIPKDLYQIEGIARIEGYQKIVGVDEAGRGPLAGPVVAASVCLPENVKIPNLNDSKKLSRASRERLYNTILNIPNLSIGLSVVSSEDVDRLNILNATHLAMKQAINHMKFVPDFILVDGRAVPGLPAKSHSIIKGDSKCACIAAASIVAKVNRDRIMVEFDSQFPGYGFGKHKGYGTKEHLENLNQLGPCSIHRKSFSPVANRLYSLF